MWRHTQGSSGRPASDLGWGSSSKTAPGSLSTGSPAGRTPPHGDGSMYSQANVSAGKVLRPPIRALPSVIVDTEKVLLEADGSVELVVVRPHADGKVFAPGCASKTGRWWPVRSPKHTSVLEYRWVKRCVWLLDRCHSIYFFGRTSRIYVVRGEINERTADIQTRSSMARTLGENGKNAKLKEAKVVTRKTSIW